MIKRIKIKEINDRYNQKTPNIYYSDNFFAGTNSRTFDVHHNHPEHFDTSYLYESSYTPERAAEINNQVIENTIKLKLCISFFDARRNNREYPINDIAQKAVLEDKIKLSSLTQKAFQPK